MKMFNTLRYKFWKQAYLYTERQYNEAINKKYSPKCANIFTSKNRPETSSYNEEKSDFEQRCERISEASYKPQGSLCAMTGVNIFCTYIQD